MGRPVSWFGSGQKGMKAAMKELKRRNLVGLNYSMARVDRGDGPEYYLGTRGSIAMLRARYGRKVKVISK